MVLVFSLIFAQLCLLIKLAGGAITSNESAIGDIFRQCLISQMPSNLGHCFGVEMIDTLQNLDSSPEFDLVDGLTLSRNSGNQEYREEYNFRDSDPSNFRSIVDSVSYIFSNRNMKWNMGFIYPGLLMHIAPSSHPGGTLEFAIDPHREGINVHELKEVGTARLMVRQFLLPLLLGFKFNVISLVPILFGLLALIIKKALVIGKVALIVSSAFALGTLLFGYSNSYPSQQYTNGHFGYGGHGGHGGHGGYGGYGGFTGYSRFPEEDYAYSSYKHSKEAGLNQLGIYPNINIEENVARVDKAKGRNFVWENEKKDKIKPI